MNMQTDMIGTKVMVTCQMDPAKIPEFKRSPLDGGDWRYLGYVGWVRVLYLDDGILKAIIELESHSCVKVTVENLIIVRE